MAALQRGSVREKQILYSGYFEAITIFTRWRGTFTHGYRSACLVRILKKLPIDDYQSINQSIYFNIQKFQK